VTAGIGDTPRSRELRHTGATLAAATGASTAELMHRLGHSSATAALIYQHATTHRDIEIARALDGLATGGKVVPVAPPSAHVSNWLTHMKPTGAQFSIVI